MRPVTPLRPTLDPTMRGTSLARSSTFRGSDPVLDRLTRLSPGLAGTKDLSDALGPTHAYAAHAQIVADGDAPATTRALRSGWASMVRIFADGRRQIQHLLLPGEIVTAPQGFHVPSAIVALTPVTLLSLDRLAISTGEAGAEAFRRSAALTHHYLLNQIARLGRQAAYERIANLLLELRDRLTLSGQAAELRFPLPLTQEMLADLLGLTSVHMNRTLQQMRRDRLITMRGGVVELLDLPALRRIAEYRSPSPLEAR